MPVYGRTTPEISLRHTSARARKASPFPAPNPARWMLPEALDSLMLSASAVELLAAMVSRAAVEPRRRKVQPAAVAELQAAGLLTADAFLTGRGHRMITPWRLVENRLALCSRSSGCSTRLDIWTGDGAALLLSGSSAGQEQLSLIPLDSLARVLARSTFFPESGFAGGAAAAEHQVLLLEGQEYEDRLAGARLPVPEGAGAQVQALLDADWTEWMLADESSGEGFSWISAPGCGVSATDSLSGGGIAVEAIAPSTLQDILMCLVYAGPGQSWSAALA